jgi:hypothetical protein
MGRRKEEGGRMKDEDEDEGGKVWQYEDCLFSGFALLISKLCLEVPFRRFCLF